MRTLRQLAAQWTAGAPDHGATSIRVDAIGVVLLPGQEPALTHVKAVG